MARYPSCQPTNIPGLPELPVGWEVKRFKNLFSTCTGITFTKADLTEDGAPVLSYGQIHSKDNFCVGVNRKLIRHIPAALAAEKALAYKGDFLFADTSEDLEGCGNCICLDTDEPIYAGSHVVLARKRHEQIGRFLAYEFTSVGWRKQLRKLVNGVKVYSVTQNILNSVLVWLPPLSVQERIVAYLDKQTAKVDALIKAKTEQMALLKELRERTIADAVTRGLPGEHTSFQSTNIPWLSEIPVSWEMKKVRQHFRLRSQKVSEKDYPALSVAKVGVVPQLDDVAISLAEGDSRKLVRRGDFVVNSRSDRKGSCGIAPRDGSVTTISIVLEPHAITHAYVHYLFRSIPWVEEFYRNGRGIVADLWTTRYQEMRNMLFPYPPLSEQERIVAYLDKQTAKIDKAVALLASGIEHLKAYRERLIADVVTGQQKVE